MPPFITSATLAPCTDPSEWGRPRHEPCTANATGNASLLLVQFSEPIIRRESPVATAAVDALRATDFVVALSAGAATMLEWAVVDWPTPPSSTATASRRRLSGGGGGSLRVALALRFDGALDGLGQSVVVGAARGALADLARNRMAADAKLAGVVSASALGGGLSGGSALSVAPAGTTLAVGVAAATTGALLLGVFSGWVLLALRRWRRRRRQANEVKEHVTELKRLLSAAP